MARKIKKNPELLAVLLYDSKKFSFKRSLEMMESVISWDLCDYLYKNLWIKQKECPLWVQKWCDTSHTFEKRAAYALIQDKQMKEEVIQEYLSMIKKYSKDERAYVKKAISWVLRERNRKEGYGSSGTGVTASV